MTEPALTAEEWANVCVVGECRNDILWGIVQGWDPCDPDQRTVEDLPHHALAALALHGQPFGFTREDVDALMYAAKDLRLAAMDVDDGDRMLAVASTLHYLASKVAALLPPEPK